MILLLLVYLCFGVSSSLDIENVVFVVLSQENKHHAHLAENLKNDITQQSQMLYKNDFQEKPVIHLSHQDFPIIGDWTVTPLIPILSDLHSSNASWIFFMYDYTKIRVNKLLEALEKYNHSEVILNFHIKKLKTASGVSPKTVVINNSPDPRHGTEPTLQPFKKIEQNHLLSSDFHIDSAHELALFIWNDGSGKPLQHEPALCTRHETHCASFPGHFQNCDKNVPKSSIFFAVKTCGKFHKDRIPIVKKTWGKFAVNIKYFSEVKDALIPTINLGIPNTENGHCEKTLAILRYVVREIEENRTDVKWIVVVDDDTILSVSKLQRLLSCYDHTEDTAIGERYGYNLNSLNGYDYVTGGGGMVFSRPLSIKLATKCKCPSLNSPDDMLLGLCLSRLGVKITHNPGFHQARPVDYPAGYLETQDAISFHKHILTDPLKVYEQWFEESDKLNGIEDIKHNLNDEL